MTTGLVIGLVMGLYAASRFISMGRQLERNKHEAQADNVHPIRAQR